MLQMILIAFLALASHSQIVRVGVFDYDNGGINNGPVEIPPVQPQPKLCSCGHHYVSEPVRPAPQNVIKPPRHQRGSEERPSSSSGDKEQGQKCENCGGKDCKCSLHNPLPRVHPKPQLIKKNGKTCDKCKDGKCECSDCKCANCSSESSSEGESQQRRPISRNLSRGQ